MTDLLIDWTAGEPGTRDASRITVLQDGHITLSPRLGGRDTVLSLEEVDALREFLFETCALGSVSQAALEREISVARTHRDTMATKDAIPFNAPQRDAVSSQFVFEVVSGRREVTVFDLAGTSQVFPQIVSIRHLREIETRLLELAQEISKRDL